MDVSLHWLFKTMQILQINAKKTKNLVYLPQIKILPKDPGFQDPEVSWKLRNN
jgi:hypothetical protein